MLVRSLYHRAVGNFNKIHKKMDSKNFTEIPDGIELNSELI